jgi:magnesium transporter
MRKFYEIRDQQVVENDNEESPIHIYVAPDDQEKRHLIERYQIDEHTLNSALDPDELSRLEFEPEHVAIVFKRPRNYSGKGQLLFKVASMGMFLFKERLIVIVSEPIALFEKRHFRRVQRRQADGGHPLAVCRFFALRHPDLGHRQRQVTP